MPSSQNQSLMQAFASEVRSRRAALKISQDELAFRSGLSRTFIGKMETARNQPSLTAFCKIADGLETSAFDLMKAVQIRFSREQKRIASDT
jgi:transcriptional regulator with XRE-family HTH domain